MLGDFTTQLQDLSRDTKFQSVWYWHVDKKQINGTEQKCTHIHTHTLNCKGAKLIQWKIVI